MADDRPLIPIARPVLGEAELDALRGPIHSGWVTQGPEVEAFEQEFAAFVGAEYACAVSSCTTALHLALKAVGVTPGSEVITVSHSFIATANSIRYCGGIPVFVDIEPGTFNIDPEGVEAALTDRTSAILCVHQLGMPCDLARIVEIGRRHNIPVVEDAACAVGSEIRWDGSWQKIGRPHGDVACFSFHPRKVITTGDGGMLTTANPAYDRKFRLWRQHGMGISDAVRHASDRVLFEEYQELGYNYRMSDIQAAIGRVQLRRLPQIVARRRELAERYRAALANMSGLRLPFEPEWARSNWQSFCVRLPDDVDQRDFMQELLDAGIASRRGVMCAHRERAYRDEPWTCGRDPHVRRCRAETCEGLRESERAQDHCIVLPLFSDMTEAELDAVADACRKAVVRASRGAAILTVSEHIG